jgi:hypothetical protein
MPRRTPNRANAGTVAAAHAATEVYDYKLAYKKFKAFVDESRELTSTHGYLTRENIDAFFDRDVRHRRTGRSSMQKIIPALQWYSDNREHVGAAAKFVVKSPITEAALKAQAAHFKSISGAGNPGQDLHYGLTNNLSTHDILKIMDYIYKILDIVQASRNQLLQLPPPQQVPQTQTQPQRRVQQNRPAVVVPAPPQVEPPEPPHNVNEALRSTIRMPQIETQMPRTMALLQASWRAHNLDAFVDDERTRRNWPHDLRLRFQRRLYLMRYIRNKMGPNDTEEAAAATADVLRGGMSVSNFLRQLQAADTNIARRNYKGRRMAQAATAIRHHRSRQGQASNAGQQNTSAFADVQPHVPPPLPPRPPPPMQPRFYAIHGDGPPPPWEQRQRFINNWQGWGGRNVQAGAGFDPATLYDDDNYYI